MEVIVTFNACRNSGVVISPFHHRNLTIILFITEVSEELKESFIFCDFSRLNFWVRGAFKCNSKIRSSNISTSSHIELAETFLNASNSGIIKLTSKATKEFIKINNSVIICVQSSHEAINFIFV